MPTEAAPGSGPRALKREFQPRVLSAPGPGDASSATAGILIWGGAAMRGVKPTLLSPSRREMLYALGAGLLAPAVARAAGFSVVAHTGGGLGANPPKTSAAIDTTGADLLVVAYVFDYRVNPSVTDSKLNTWTGLTPKTGSNAGAVKLYYVKNPMVGSGHTVTLNAAGGPFYGAAYFAAFRGADVTAPFDVENGANSNGTTIQPGGVSPTLGGELVISAMAMNVTGNPTVDASMNMLDNNGLSPGTYYGGGMAYKIQTTAAAINPVWTVGSYAANACVIASFKAASTPSSSSRVMHRVTGGE